MRLKLATQISEMSEKEAAEHLANGPNAVKVSLTAAHSLAEASREVEENPDTFAIGATEEMLRGSMTVGGEERKDEVPLDVGVKNEKMESEDVDLSSLSIDDMTPTFPPSSRAIPEGSALSVKQLKELLGKAGVDYSSCIEKGELLALAEQNGLVFLHMEDDLGGPSGSGAGDEVLIVARRINVRYVQISLYRIYLVFLCNTGF